LIEEAPSPAINQQLRDRICAAALKGAKAVGYTSAGTIEFLLDTDGNFYFMEVNTRIQVEHPVTEMVIGLDLVKEQIRLAAKGKLDSINYKMRGHAIECRINAENPTKNFMPSPGTITYFHIPGGPGVRVDTHAYAQYVIPPYYDSLLAKVIIHGRTREEALRRLQRALEEFVIEGVQTTIPFHLKVLEDERFRNGEYDINFLESFELSS